MSNQLALTKVNSQLTKVEGMTEELKVLLNLARDTEAPVANKFETLYKDIQRLKNTIVLRKKCLEKPGVGVLVEDIQTSGDVYKFHVSVPEGASEGFMLFVKAPNGKQMKVRVPKGATAGTILLCSINLNENGLDELD
ncbi:MAG: hypothetical protein CMG60_07990 [Candidatus Marinimicrobia bacterium]|nr:hypothetical protein [Candidatus Neomarinimicrobiota bacterium]|tara:strand:+ start:94 stop:507 length:414 start_codon:yes stop_codon:yes gene_type:complete